MTQKKSELSIQPRRKESVSERIDDLVQVTGSVARLSDLAGVSETTIRKWKSGESEPTVSRLVRLARCTGVDVGWLATGEGSPDGAAPAQVKEEAPSYASNRAFSPQDVEGVILLVETHPATKGMEAEQKAAYIRDLLEWELRRRDFDKQAADRMLEEGPPQSED